MRRCEQKIKKLYQSAVLLPYLMSIVIISYIVFAFLSTENGMVNNSLLIPFGKIRFRGMRNQNTGRLF